MHVIYALIYCKDVDNSLSIMYTTAMILSGFELTSKLVVVATAHREPTYVRTYGHAYEGPAIVTFIPSLVRTAWARQPVGPRGSDRNRCKKSCDRHVHRYFAWASWTAKFLSAALHMFNVRVRTVCFDAIVFAGIAAFIFYHICRHVFVISSKSILIRGDGRCAFDGFIRRCLFWLRYFFRALWPPPPDNKYDKHNDKYEDNKYSDR